MDKCMTETKGHIGHRTTQIPRNTLFPKGEKKKRSKIISDKCTNRSDLSILWRLELNQQLLDKSKTSELEWFASCKSK